MASGEQKQLRDIRPGDHVATYDNGSLSSSKVNNWINHGPDLVYKIKTKSGVTVKANARHPFLVEENGVREWRRTGTLKKGNHILKATGESGMVVSARPKGAISNQPAKGSAPLTTTKTDGQEASGRHQSTHSVSERPTSDTDTKLILKSMISSILSRVESARSVNKGLGKVLPGARSICSLITATIRKKYGGFYAIPATLPLGTFETLKTFSPPLNTCDFTTDEILEISVSGTEDVFDIEVDRTENFIANGLVSHNTRWHEDDLAGRLIQQQQSGDPDALPWVRVRFPAIFEEGTPEHPVSPYDKRKIGEPLWPNKYDEKRMRQIKAAVTTRDWTALYQQRPSVDEGGIISKSWLKYYGGFNQPGLPPRFDKIVQSWDLNFKEGLKVDFVVGQIWGRFGPDFYLLDQFRERIGFVDTLEAIRDMTKKWPQATGKLIEAKANGEAVMDALKKGDPKNGLPGVTGIIPVTPTESKEARLWATQPLFKAGNVWYPDPGTKPWAKDAIDELVKFPNTKNDDTVDTTSQALKDLASARNNVLENMTR
jgi:predicted phage terminase large subunit-like protein